MKKLLALLLAAVMVLSLVACAPKTPADDNTKPSDEPTPEVTDPIEETEPERDALENYVYGEDYDSLYNVIGDKVTIDMVYEVDGLAYVEVDGVEYELGMDYLSMAMVYNTTPAGDFATELDVYTEWWRYYIQRWNYLAAEVPLYSNQYYTVYDSKLQGYEVGPYFGANKALPLCTIDETKGDNSIVFGSVTDMTGSFRYASFGRTNPGAADLDIQTLTSGLGTIETDKNGVYQWNPTVVADHVETVNEDGSKTYEIKLHEDLMFSDGSPITAKNYLAYTLAFGTPVATQAASRDGYVGMTLVGFDAYHGATETTPFAGLRLIDEYTFAVTVAADYLPYYFDITYAGFSPEYLGLWLGDNFDIVDDGEGAYIKGLTENDNWYEQDGEGSYVHAQHIIDAHWDVTTYPYSGPYCLTEYDEAAMTAVMTINPNYKGNKDGIKPSIETISYIKLVDETQIEQLKAGETDMLCDVTGGPATDAALAVAAENTEKYATTYYNRAGYGKLGYRADFGPTFFTEVRQAIMYLIDRNAFAQTFTGGYGAVVHGPYYAGSPEYLANEDKMLLNQYAVSEASAIAVLEEGGWIYNADGTEYSGEGVRYKKLSKADLSENNLAYASLDGVYKTVEVNGEYYMPLAINWFCSEKNEVSEMLKTAFAGSELVKNAGMNVQYTQGDFGTLLAEYGQDKAAGYTGPALYSAFNLATGLTTSIYDYSWNWTIDPDLFNNYSAFCIKDEADFYWYN